MEIVQLAQYRNRDTVALLKCLLERAERGDVEGVAICYLDIKGSQEAAFSGAYRRNPCKGVAAAMSLSMQLAQYDELQRRS